MRRRNMFNLTGLPGFMRFGAGMGAGLGLGRGLGMGRGYGGFGPCAQYLLTGQWPTPFANQTAQADTTEPVDPADRLPVLQMQVNLLQQQLAALQQEISDIEKS